MNIPLSETYLYALFLNMINLQVYIPISTSFNFLIFENYFEMEAPRI